MQIRSTAAFAAGAVTALILGTGTAYAATGGTFVLGRSNSANATTTLTNSNGTALVLNSKAGQPSLKVNRNTKVPSLNADLLDGVDSASLARTTRIGTVEATGFVYDNGTSDPYDDVVMAEAVCPAGSQVVGGGALDFTDEGVALVSAPFGGDVWVVMSSTPTMTQQNAEKLVAMARCWNPKANVADVQMRSTARRLSPTGRDLAARVATR